MGRHLGFVALSQKVYTKIVILLCLILILGSAGIAQMVFAIPEYLDNGLNPIPYSPAPNIDQVVRLEGNNQFHQIKPQNSIRENTLIRARISSYASSVSYTINQNNDLILNHPGFEVGYDPSTQFRTNTLLMYPQVRDIIPPSATISEAIIITGYSQNPGSIYNLQVSEITSRWDPRIQLISIPTINGPISSGVWDTGSTTINNRYLDVTQTVQSWFNGLQSQWGFMISTSDTSQIDLITDYPPRLYITYYMPETSFNTNNVSGGTLYYDNVCPPMWLPRRASYIAKYGILDDNFVQTEIVCATNFTPPYGYDNQSFRWVFPGKPYDSNKSFVTWLFDAKMESAEFYNSIAGDIPPVDVGPFWSPNSTGGDVIPNPDPTPPIIGGGDTSITNDFVIPTLYLEEKEICIELLNLLHGGDDKKPEENPPKDENKDPKGEGGNEGNPPSGTGGGNDPEPVAPVPSNIPRSKISYSSSSNGITSPPVRSIPPIDSQTHYNWSPLPKQWLVFRNNSDYDLDPIDTSSNDWFNNFKNIGNSGAVRSGGNINCTYGADFTANWIYHQNLGYSDAGDGKYTQQISSLNSITVNNISEDPPANDDKDKEDKKKINIPIVIKVIPFLAMYTHNVDGIPIDPSTQPPIEPNCMAYSDALPYPETEQAIDVGFGNAETTSFKQICSGTDHIINPINGSVEHSICDFSIPIHGGLKLDFTRSYSSALSNVAGSLGPGWFSSLDEKVVFLEEGYIRYYSSTGETYLFSPNRAENGVITSWSHPPQLEVNLDVLGEGDNSYVTISDSATGITKTFGRNGLLSGIHSNIDGNIGILRHSTTNKILNITDTYSGSSLSFSYDSYNRLVSVTGPDNQRNWTYEYDANNNLYIATNPIGGTWKYYYNSLSKLTKITNPRNYNTYFNYNNDKVTSITNDASTDQKIFTYVDELRAANVKEPSGSDITFLFTETSRFGAIVDNNGRWLQFDYSKQYFEQPERIYNQLGNIVISNLLDNEGRVVKAFDAVGNYQSITYNNLGKISSITDREGNTTYYNWNNDASLLLSCTDSLNRTILYTYDEHKNLVSVTKPFKDNESSITQYEYDSYGFINKVIDPLGNITTSIHNKYGELLSTTNSQSSVVTYTYNKMGWLTKIQGPSPNNYSIDYTYDENGNTTSIKNPRNFTTYFYYNQIDKLIRTVNALNENTYYEYDSAGKPTKLTDNKNNDVSFIYDNCGRSRYFIDQNDKRTKIVYNNIGLVAGYENNASERTKTFSYNQLNRLVEFSDAESALTKYEYDKEGNLVKIIDPLNKQVIFTYDDVYRVTKITDNSGNFTSTEYYPSGLIKKITDPLNHSTYYDYNKNGQLTSCKDHNSNEIKFEYDSLGQLVKCYDQNNQFIEYQYNNYGLVSNAKNELGKITSFEYDENGNCTKQTTPMGRSYFWFYDAIDRQYKYKTPLGYEYIKTYDEVGNLIQLEDPLSHLEKFTYNNNYSLDKYIDQINNETKYEYDSNDRVNKISLPKLNYQSYTYDKNNNLKSATDPLGNIASYSYNLAGQLVDRSLPAIGGGTTSFTYTYDNLGRRVSFTDEANNTTSIQYNSINKVTNIQHPNSKTISSTYDTLNRLTGVTFGGGETFSYSYDALGRTTGATDQHGTKSISYDAASRVTSSTDPFGDQTSLSYDDDDRVTSVTTPLGATSTTYDNDSRPTQINLASGGQINNTFDNAARLTHSDIPNGVDLDFTYNNANNPTNKTYSLPDPFFNNGPKVQTFKPKDPDSLFVTIGKQAQSLYNKLGPNPTFGDICTLLLDQKFYGTLRTIPVIVASFSYTYDANKNITQRSYPNGIQNFTYDNYDRLTQAIASEGTYTYTYDVRNNRSTMRFVNYNQTVDQTTTYTYSIDDRLTSYTVVNNLNQQTIRTVNYTYDDAGNTLTKAVTEGGTTLTTTYTYYDDNRLKTTTLPSNEIITYTYHADGTRATKSNATEWIRYHYSGGLVKEVHCDKNNHSTILFTIHYQPGRIIYQPNQGNNVYYYTASDCSGTIYKLLNDQGQIVASYNYDPFGVLIENTNPSIYMPIGYSGTYRDTETGLLYAQSRYYDPSVGRFTTKDSYRGELVSQISQNRYIYCSQNPVSYGDPSGFAPIEGDDANHANPTDLYQKSEPIKSPDAPKSEHKILEDEYEGGEKDPGYGNVVENKDGSYTANIGGHLFKISFDSNGKATVKCIHKLYLGQPVPDDWGDSFANGMQDAFNSAGPELVKLFKGDPKGFVSEMTTFLSNQGDFEKMYGGNLYDFAFCATIGWGAAKLIENGKNVSGSFDESLWASLGAALKKSGSKMSVFQFLMSQGFWAAHWNSSVSYSQTQHRNIRMLYISFNDNPVNVDLFTKIDLANVVRVQSSLWLVTSICGTYNGNGSIDLGGKSVAKYAKDVVAKLFIAAKDYLLKGFGITLVINSFFESLLTGTIDDFITGLITGTDKSNESQRSKVVNSAGVTVGMQTILEDDYGLNSRGWDKNSMFCILGMSTHMLHLLTLDSIKSEEAFGVPGGGHKYDWGHVYCGVDYYMSASFSADTGLETVKKLNDFFEPFHLNMELWEKWKANRKDSNARLVSP